MKNLTLTDDDLDTVKKAVTLYAKEDPSAALGRISAALDLPIVAHAPGNRDETRILGSFVRAGQIWIVPGSSLVIKHGVGFGWVPELVSITPMQAVGRHTAEFSIAALDATHIEIACRIVLTFGVSEPAWSDRKTAYGAYITIQKIRSDLM